MKAIKIYIDNIDDVLDVKENIDSQTGLTLLTLSRFPITDFNPENHVMRIYLPPNLKYLYRSYLHKAIAEWNLEDFGKLTLMAWSDFASTHPDGIKPELVTGSLFPEKVIRRLNGYLLMTRSAFQDINVPCTVLSSYNSLDLNYVNKTTVDITVKDRFNKTSITCPSPKVNEVLFNDALVTLLCGLYKNSQADLYALTLEDRLQRNISSPLVLATKGDPNIITFGELIDDRINVSVKVISGKLKIKFGD